MATRSLPGKPGKITPKILNEQTRFSYNVFPFTVWLLVVAIVLTFFLVWQEISKTQALYWMIAATIVLLIRGGLYFFYKRAGADADSAWWRHAFLIGAYVTASLTCLAAILFFSEFSESSKMIFTLLVVGLVSGALPVLATDLKTYAIYVSLNIIPLALINLSAPEMSVKLIGAVTLVFAGMLMIAAHLFNRALLDSMIYRYKSEMLAERLQTANNRLSSANQELQQISTIDELTGVYNRRFFNYRIQEVWADHVRENQLLAALMIDVDHFKAYNDFFGHLQGDHCLKRIAGEITGVIRRPRDFVARFGGEEFIMLLPNTDNAGAREIAARIHQQIRKLAIPHKRKDSPSLVTVSIGGVSFRPSSDNNYDEFLKRVDDALYQAKHQGRNTTVVV